jgi:hypothetical protein
MSPPPNQPDDLRAIVFRVEALERWMRDGDARERRLMSEVQGEYASLVDALKRHTDASNQAQIQPVLMRLAQLEASIARMLATDAEDRELKERMRIALSEHAAAVAAETRLRAESRAELEAKEVRESRAKEHRKAVLTIVVPIVVTLLGLVGAAITSHFTHP